MDRQTPDEAMGQPEMPILERQSQTTSDEVGGIDMNPQLIDFTKEGSGFEFDWSLDTQDLPSGPIEGFIPIIINITPVTDIPLLLGIKNKTGQDNTLLELSQKN